MINMKDPFERSIRQSLEGFEVPYNSTDWAAMENALSGAKPSGWWTSPMLYAALLAGSLAIGGGVYLVDREMNDEVANAAGTTGSAASPSTDGTTENGTDPQPAVTGADEVSETANGLATIPADPTDTEGARNTDRSGAPASTKKLTSPSTDGTTGGDDRSVKVEPIAKGPEEKPVAKGAFSASVSKGCEGAAVEFSVNEMPEDGIYLWNFGDGTFSNKANPTHTYTKAGKFTVTLSMSGAGKGTIRNEPYADLIVIDEVPEARFEHTYRAYAGHVPSMHFENRSHGGSRYHWDFGDGSGSDVAHPDHVYRAKGTYKVVLTVYNDSGCEDVLVKDVRVDEDYNLLAPRSFSPNGDGSEDHFMPQALKELGVKFSLSIFEPTSGRLVYQTGDASKPWTGRLMNSGAVCAAGEYVWMVEIKEGLHIGDITYEGKVSLVK